MSNFVHALPPVKGNVWAFKIFLLTTCSLSKSQNAKAKKKIFWKLFYILKIGFKIFFSEIISLREKSLFSKLTVPPRSAKHQIKSSPIRSPIKMIALGNQNLFLILLRANNYAVGWSKPHLKYWSINLQENIETFSENKYAHKPLLAW